MHLYWWSQNDWVHMGRDSVCLGSQREEFKSKHFIWELPQGGLLKSGEERQGRGRSQ